MKRELLFSALSAALCLIHLAATAAEPIQVEARTVPPATNQAKRSWGTEQATGAPDALQGGDNVNAWASQSADGSDEWLVLDYAEAVIPTVIKVYENYCPGALNRVSVFKEDGTEVEVWRGKDPTPTTADKGVSIIPVKSDFKTSRVKIYLDSKSVPGWNEIDAVALIDTSEKTHWATTVEASSSYASPHGTTWIPDPTAQELTDLKQQLNSLEEEVKKLRAAVEELTKALKQQRAAP